MYRRPGQLVEGIRSIASFVCTLCVHKMTKKTEVLLKDCGFQPDDDECICRHSLVQTTPVMLRLGTPFLPLTVTSLLSSVQ